MGTVASIDCSLNDRWSNEDTDVFYKVLGHFGADFNLIVRIFPCRNQNQIKNKYCKEWNDNPQAVSTAMACAFDNIQHYEMMKALNH
jgi:hypothetical protein